MKDLREFNSLPDLRELSVIQSNIISIDGLQKITKLELSYNSFLEINETGQKFPEIEELEINSCPKVGFNFFKLFPNVKKIKLIKFQDILTLKPLLDELPELEELFIGQTKIIESDNRYYSGYTNIKRFYFDERKYHLLTNADLGKDDF